MKIRKITPEQRSALEELKQAAQWRVEADEAYRAGLMMCADMGLRSAEIGHALGISEAAVRMAQNRIRKGAQPKPTKPPQRDVQRSTD